MLLPASDLVKIALGTMEMPTTKEEWANIAVNTVLDLIPGVKMLKSLKGGVAKLGIKNLGKMLEKEAKKAAKRAARQKLREEMQKRRAERKSKSATDAQQHTGNPTNGGVGGQPTTNKKEKSTPKPWNGKYKKKKSGVSGKEGAKDPPEWAKEHRPREGESGKEFAKRIMDEKYGAGKYQKGSGSEFSQIQKWADRSFE